jgi:hypothetical protein
MDDRRKTMLVMEISQIPQEYAAVLPAIMHLIGRCDMFSNLFVQADWFLSYSAENGH